jgi:hypothetical protein
MVLNRRRIYTTVSLGALLVLAALAAGFAANSPARGGFGCGNGKTTFKFKAPDGVSLKPTHGAVKRGPSKIQMLNCGGNFDPATGVGSLSLEGGVNFKFEHNRGPTGDFRIRYGGVGKLRARVVGKPANIAKVSGGHLAQDPSGATTLKNAKLKLTTKGAKRLNQAVEATKGPFEKGKFGSVTTVVGP